MKQLQFVDICADHRCKVETLESIVCVAVISGAKSGHLLYVLFNGILLLLKALSLI